MTISSYLFGIGLALITAVYIARPFIKRSTTPRSSLQAGRRQQLLAHKASLYAAIREIDTDVQLGKLESADHRVLRQRYVTEGVAVLRAPNHNQAFYGACHGRTDPRIIYRRTAWPP